MSDFFEKINKTIDIITDALVDQIPAVNETKEYRFADLSAYIKKMSKEHPEMRKFTIAISKSSEFSGKVYASERFIIRIVMLDENRVPIIVDGNPDEYYGTIIIAEAIDVRLKEKMGGEDKKTFTVGGR